MKEAARKFIDLMNIVSRLRGPEGCPWDQKQTPQRFKSYLIEEAHELLEAIELGDPVHIQEELGDLLFQLTFLVRLYEEKQLLSMAGVIEGISAKMIRRHPHVFGDLEAGSEEDLRRRWQEIKAKEKAGKSLKANSFESLPKSMPALRRAQRVVERAPKTHRGSTLADLSHNLETKSGQAAAKVLGQGTEAFRTLGDLLFATVTLCSRANINAEDALQEATDQAIGRYLEEGSSETKSPVKSGKKI